MSHRQLPGVDVVYTCLATFESNYLQVPEQYGTVYYAPNTTNGESCGLILPLGVCTMFFYATYTMYVYYKLTKAHLYAWSYTLGDEIKEMHVFILKREAYDVAVEWVHAIQTLFWLHEWSTVSQDFPTLSILPMIILATAIMGEAVRRWPQLSDSLVPLQDESELVNTLMNMSTQFPPSLCSSDGKAGGRFTPFSSCESNTYFSFCHVHF